MKHLKQLLERMDYECIGGDLDKEFMPNGSLHCDLQTAYMYLNKAKIGYEIE